MKKKKKKKEKKKEKKKKKKKKICNKNKTLREKVKKQQLRDSNPGPHIAEALLYQLSYSNEGYEQC